MTEKPSSIVAANFRYSAISHKIFEDTSKDVTKWLRRHRGFWTGFVSNEAYCEATGLDFKTDYSVALFQGIEPLFVKLFNGLEFELATTYYEVVLQGKRSTKELTDVVFLLGDSTQAITARLVFHLEIADAANLAPITVENETVSSMDPYRAGGLVVGFPRGAGEAYGFLSIDNDSSAPTARLLVPAWRGESINQLIRNFDSLVATTNGPSGICQTSEPEKMGSFPDTNFVTLASITALPLAWLDGFVAAGFDKDDLLNKALVITCTLEIPTITYGIRAE